MADDPARLEPEPASVVEFVHSLRYLETIAYRQGLDELARLIGIAGMAAMKMLAAKMPAAGLPES